MSSVTPLSGGLPNSVPSPTPAPPSEDNTRTPSMKAGADDFKRMMAAASSNVGGSDDDSDNDSNEEDNFDVMVPMLSNLNQPPSVSGSLAGPLSLSMNAGLSVKTDPSLLVQAHDDAVGRRRSTAGKAPKVDYDQLQAKLTLLLSTTATEIVNMLKQSDSSSNNPPNATGRRISSRQPSHTPSNTSSHTLSHSNSHNHSQTSGRRKTGRTSTIHSGRISGLFRSGVHRNSTSRSGDWDPLKEMTRLKSTFAGPTPDKHANKSAASPSPGTNPNASAESDQTLSGSAGGRRTSRPFVPVLLDANKARQKKRTIFARAPIQGASGKTLSRGDNRKADALKHMLEAERKQQIILDANARATIIAAETAEAKAADEASAAALTTAEEGTAPATTTESKKETPPPLTTAPPAATLVTQETMLSIEDMLEEDYDPEATLILLAYAPFVLISHDSEARGLWENMIMCLVLFQAIQAPYEMVFESVLLGPWWDFCMIVIFFLDFFHNFITTYCNDNGDLVIDPKLIVQYYVSGPWFWVDLISCIPFDAIVSSKGNASSTLKTVKLLRMARMGKILKRVDNLVKAGSIRLVRLLGILFLFFHWTSCGWFASGKLWLCRNANFDIAYLENATNSTYAAYMHDAGVPDFGIDPFDSDPRHRGPGGLKYEAKLCESYLLAGREEGLFEANELYFYAVHQASTSLMGGGGAYTKSEQIYFSFIVILGAILQATVFGSVAVLLASVDEDAVRFQKKMLTINLRMAYLEVPLNLQERVRTYYQKMWDTERSLTTNPNEFIDEVSKPLAADIKMKLYQNLLESVDFFKSTSDIVVEELVKCLKNQLYLEGDIIMRKGEAGSWMAFIARGQVAILSPETGKVIRVMDPGEYLGEMALLYRVNRTVDVRALSWVSMNILTSADMARVKEEYPEDVAFIENELEEMMIKKQYQHVDVDDSDEDSDSGSGSKSGSGSESSSGSESEEENGATGPKGASPAAAGRSSPGEDSSASPVSGSSSSCATSPGSQAPRGSKLNPKPIGSPEARKKSVRTTYRLRKGSKSSGSSRGRNVGGGSAKGGNMGVSGRGDMGASGKIKSPRSSASNNHSSRRKSRADSDEYSDSSEEGEEETPSLKRITSQHLKPANRLKMVAQQIKNNRKATLMAGAPPSPYSSGRHASKKHLTKVSASNGD